MEHVFCCFVSDCSDKIICLSFVNQTTLPSCLNTTRTASRPIAATARNACTMFTSNGLNNKDATSK